MNLIVWLGFFAIFIGVLALDLGVLHRESRAMAVRQALGWTVVWILVALSFAALVYGVYEHHWFGWALGADAPGGSEAAIAVHHRLPARMVAVGRQYFRDRSDLHVHEDPAAVSVSRAVLGHRWAPSSCAAP